MLIKCAHRGRVFLCALMQMRLDVWACVHVCEARLCVCVWSSYTASIHPLWREQLHFTDLFNLACRRELWQLSQSCVPQHNNTHQRWETNKQTITLSAGSGASSRQKSHAKQTKWGILSKMEWHCNAMCEERQECYGSGEKTGLRIM